MGGCNTGACAQLPLGTHYYATCLALPLPELLMRTSFLFDGENDEQGCLELNERKPVKYRLKRDRNKKVGREREAKRGRRLDRSEHNVNES